MLGKRDARTFLRISNPFHRCHGNLELAIARSAGANCRDGPEPFEHSKSALFHMVRCSEFHFKKGQRVALAGCYYQKTLKLVRTKVFSGGVTKITVLEVAIGKSEFDLVGLTVFLSNAEMRSNSIHDGYVNSSGYSGD